MIPTAPVQRRCFCLACTRTPLPGHWHCEYHERANHAASEADAERSARRRQAKDLAALLPHTRLANQIHEEHLCRPPTY